jgi:hypothetical protein
MGCVELPVKLFSQLPINPLNCLSIDYQRDYPFPKHPFADADRCEADAVYDLSRSSGKAKFWYRITAPYLSVLT